MAIWDCSAMGYNLFMGSAVRQAMFTMHAFDIKATCGTKRDAAQRC